MKSRISLGISASTAAFLASMFLAGCSDKAPELHVLQWSDYFAKDTIANFEKDFGCKVKIDYIESSETLRSKLEGGNSGYDVAFPSDDIMTALISKGMLVKLDHAQLPHLKNLEEAGRQLPYDVGNVYSVPYMWGTTGLAYNTKEVTAAPTSWSALWEPRFAGKLTLIDDYRETMAMAMLKNGDDPSKPTPESIERAKKALLELKPLAYHSAPKDMLITGDALIAHCFNGDAYQAAMAKERGADLGYVIPQEGGMTWVDNMAIPQGADEVKLAHAFIDYLLKAEVAAANSNELCYGSPNQAAREKIDAALLANPLIFPNEETRRRCKVFADPSSEQRKAMLAAWAEVKGR